MPLSLQETDWDNELSPIVVPPAVPKTRKVRKVRVKYGTLACAVLVVYFFVNIIQLHLSIISLDRRIESKMLEKQQLLSYQEKLQQDVEMLNTGEYIEKLAREQLGMVKPGENPVRTRNN